MQRVSHKRLVNYLMIDAIFPARTLPKLYIAQRASRLTVRPSHRWRPGLEWIIRNWDAHSRPGQIPPGPFALGRYHPWHLIRPRPLMSAINAPALVPVRLGDAVRLGGSRMGDQKRHSAPGPLEICMPRPASRFAWLSQPALRYPSASTALESLSQTGKAIRPPRPVRRAHWGPAAKI